MAREKQLHITKEVPLPSNAVTQKYGWLGTSGGGKTYGAMRFAEELWDQKAQFVALDPVGVWYGLRLDKGGKKSSDISIPIFGGLHGDIPLEPTSGPLIADLIVDKGISAIIDVSQFESDAEKARFAGAFADRFFFRKKAAPGAIHLFIEECQEFVPQNPQRGEERMVHAFTRLQKIGRNFGVGTSLITQRPQEVSKRALNLAGTLFVFRTTGSHERKAIEIWMQDKSIEEQDLIGQLPKLETGAPHLWSPEWLKESKVVHILEKRTFDASATPEVGGKAVARELAHIDLEKVKSDMAATIERAKSEDPRELKKIITGLELELKKKGNPVVDPAAIQKAVDKAFSDGAASANREFEKERAQYRFALTNASNTLKQIEKLTNRPEVLDLTKIDVRVPPVPIQRASAGVSPARKPEGSTPPETPRHKGAPSGTEALPADASDISGPEQKVLDAIAWMETIGITMPARTVIAFLAGYSNTKSTGFTNPCGSLRSKGLISYPNGDTISLTDDGRAAAHAPTVQLDAQGIQQAVKDKLPGPERKILEALLAVYPGGITNPELAAATGYSNEKSTGYTNPRGRLRSFELIQYLTGGMVRAADILFPS